MCLVWEMSFASSRVQAASRLLKRATLVVKQVQVSKIHVVLEMPSVGTVRRTVEIVNRTVVVKK